jgi:hypothetical protein
MKKLCSTRVGRIDKWIQYYNSERTHSGRYCYGKAPLQTFLDSKTIAKSKNVNELFDKRDNFKLPEKAESGSAGEQPARNTQADGNEKEAENLHCPQKVRHFLGVFLWAKTESTNQLLSLN